MDDILCDDISRGSFGAEQQGERPLRFVPSFNLPVLPDDIEGVHLLAFILMQTLDLDVINGSFINADLFGSFQIFLQRMLIILFDLQQPVQHGFIVPESQQLFQLARVLFPAASDQLGDKGGKRRVTMHQPSAEGDAVGFVVELFRIDVMEHLQLRGFQNLRMQRRHAVDRKAIVYIHVGHMHQVAVIDD